MATILFADTGLSVEVEDGSRLQAAIDKHKIDIPFGCREGACATCMIEVTEGAESLNSVTSDEEMTLMPDELEAGLRLACQCIVKGGRVGVKVSDGII